MVKDAVETKAMAESLFILLFSLILKIRKAKSTTMTMVNGNGSILKYFVMAGRAFNDKAIDRAPIANDRYKPI